MPLRVYRLRRILAATAALLILVVAGMYFYARSRATNVLNSIPGKIGFDVKQTAHGFQFSKSDGKRTLFTVQASDIKEFKLNGNAELHNVSIVLYGRDSSRFDQIYGDEFAFNQKTGNVTAKGDVQIDLVANPAGVVSPDQSTPKEMKNPIHLKTRDLVFNKDTGDAYTNERVEFRTPQASGWAVGVKYAGKASTLTLSSEIHITLTGSESAEIEAQQGVITNDPRQIVLDHPRLARADGTVQSDRATFYLNQQNHVERVLASGNVTTETQVKAAATRNAPSVSGAAVHSEMHGHADEAEFLLDPDEQQLRTATFQGNVLFEQTGAQPMQGSAGRVVADFAGQNHLTKIHALNGATLTQKTSRVAVSPQASPQTTPQSAKNSPQDFELAAPAIDFVVARGHVLKRATTEGAARITVVQTPFEGTKTAERTVVTAGKFDATFASNDGRNHLASVHGAPDARIVDSNPGQPDRVSTSDSLDASFLPQGGIESITQKGSVVYTDGQAGDKKIQAWANTALYTPSDQMLVLSGKPRVANGGMMTTCNTVRLNRANGEALADGDVKSTYSDLKEQPGGALLAASSPIHVTAQSMTSRSNPGIATYKGDARLWQDANVIQAPSIQFDRERRGVTATGSASQPVQTILVEKETAASKGVQQHRNKQRANSPGSTAILITSTKLTYADDERRVHYEGGVMAKGDQFSASAKSVDAYLVARSQISVEKAAPGPGQLDHMVAEGDVSVQQPKRRAEGQKLVYTAADDKFVLSGGPPSIFDAEQGKITGVSLTFFRRDDRVLVEGEASTPVVTTTRVAR